MVPWNFTLMRGCRERSSARLAPVSAVHEDITQGQLVPPATAVCCCISSPQKWDRHVTDLETAAVKARKDDST